MFRPYHCTTASPPLLANMKTCIIKHCSKIKKFLWPHFFQSNPGCNVSNLAKHVSAVDSLASLTDPGIWQLGLL